MKCPCFGCSDRAAGCHDKCEKYTAWRKDYEQQKNVKYSNFIRDHQPMTASKVKNWDRQIKGKK